MGPSGPGKKGSNGPGKKGSKGPGQKGSKGPGQKVSKGPKPGGGANATVTRVGDTTTIADNFGAFIESLVPLPAPNGDTPQAGSAPGAVPEAGKVTGGDVAGGIRTGGPASQDIQALKEDIAVALGRSPRRLDDLFKESGGATWSVADLMAVKDVIDKIPPADRPALAHTTFERARTLPSEDGRPNYGHAEFTRSDFEDRAVVKIADVAAGLDDQGKATGPNVVGQVVAHELGHVVMGDGRWNSNEVREFAKLSHWVRQGPPESLVNGYDDHFNTIDFETRDYAKNSLNFVSDYAKESAVEDFAESYRSYLSNPGELMAKAPDKFLYLNAQSKKYTADQVQGFANVVGADLPFVMAGLGKSNLRADTLAAIAEENGLQVPGTGSGAGDAIAAIQEKSLDPAFGLKLRQDPRAALGDETWSKLAASEQALLQDDAYVGKLLAATAANKTTPADTITNGDVAGWKSFLGDILLHPPADPDVFQAFNGTGQDAKVRNDYLWNTLHKPEHWDKLSPAMQQLFDSEKGKQFIAQMASDRNNLDLTKLAWSTESAGIFGKVAVPDLKKFDNISTYIDSIGPADVEALGSLVRRGITDDEALQVGRANQALAQGGSLPQSGHIPAV